MFLINFLEQVIVTFLIISISGLHARISHFVLMQHENKKLGVQNKSVKPKSPHCCKIENEKDNGNSQ